MQSNRLRLPAVMLYVMFIFNVGINLIPQWKAGYVYNTIGNETFVNFLLTLSNYVNTLLAILIIISSSKVQSRQSLLLMIIVSIGMLFSIMVNQSWQSFTQLIGFFIIYTALFSFAVVDKSKYAEGIIRLITVILLLWCVLPVIYIPFASGDVLLALFSSDNEAWTSSFAGLARHRNFYGYYAGITLVLMVIQHGLFKNFILKFASYALLIVGIFISDCRAVIAALGLSFFLYFFNILKRNRFLTILLSLIVIFGFYYVSTVFETRLTTAEMDREDVWLGFINYIFENPIFGGGGQVLLFNGEHPAHNFVLQVMADYGQIVAFCFFFFLFYQYIKSSKESRFIWLFFLTFMLFQPYFYIATPNEVNIITLCLIVLFNGIKSRKDYEINKNSIKPVI